MSEQNTHIPAEVLASPIITIDHPTHPALCGEITFKHPTLADDLRIANRSVQLANLATLEGERLLKPSDLDPDDRDSIIIIATLEQVIKRAPAGFFTPDEAGRPVLNLLALDPLELSLRKGVLYTLYVAYTTWRESFRQHRTGTLRKPEGEQRSQSDRLGSTASPETDPARSGAAGHPDHPTLSFDFGTDPPSGDETQPGQL